MRDTNIAASISKWSRHYGVASSLVDAFIRIESNYDVTARGALDEMGLGQLRPMTVDDFELQNPGIEIDPWKIDDNVRVVAWLLGKRIPGQLAERGFPLTYSTLIQGYNRGPRRVNRLPIPDVTLAYMDKVERILGVDRDSPISSGIIKKILTAGMLWIILSGKLS